MPIEIAEQNRLYKDPFKPTAFHCVAAIRTTVFKTGTAIASCQFFVSADKNTDPQSWISLSSVHLMELIAPMHMPLSRFKVAFGHLMNC